MKAKPFWSDTENKWYYRVTFNGVRKTFVSRKAGRAGRLAVIHAAEEFEDGKIISKTTVDKIFELALEEYKLKKPSSQMIQAYENIAKRYITPAIGNKKINTLKQNDFQSVIVNSNKYSTKENLSVGTLNNIRLTLNLIINYAVINDYMSPLKAPLWIPQTAIRNKRRESLQPNDIKKLFSEELDSKWYINAFRFACITGLRPSELLGLQWSDISEDGKTFTVTRGWTSTNKISNLKTENAHRTIAINQTAKQILEAQKYQTLRLHSLWIFCAPSGCPTNHRTFEREYKSLEITGTPYSLRHTLVSMVKNEMSVEMVKAVVGHSYSMDTFGHYGHVLDGELQQAGTIIDNTLNRIINN